MTTTVVVEKSDLIVLCIVISVVTIWSMQSNKGQGSNIIEGKNDDGSTTTTTAATAAGTTAASATAAADDDDTPPRKTIFSIRTILRRICIVLFALQLIPLFISKLVSILIGVMNSICGPGSDLYQAVNEGDYNRVILLLNETTTTTTEDGSSMIVENGRSLLFGLLMSVSPLSTALKVHVASTTNDDGGDGGDGGGNGDAIINALLKAGANVNNGITHGGPYGFISKSTPLLIAIKSSSVSLDVIKELVKRGANPNEGTSVGPYGIGAFLPPIVFAASSNSGSSNKQHNKGLTTGESSNSEFDENDGEEAEGRRRSSSTSSSSPATSKLQILLENGADPNLCSTLGYSSSFTALHVAISENNTHATELLLNHSSINVNAISKMGPLGMFYRETPIFVATRVNSISTISNLINKKKKKENKNGGGSSGVNVQLGRTNGPLGLFSLISPLSVACQRNSTEIVSLLLKAGANPDRGVEIGPPIPTFFARGGKNNNNNININNNNRRLSLYTIPPITSACDASNGPYIEIIHMLLDYGADRNICAKHSICKSFLMKRDLAKKEEEEEKDHHHQKKMVESSSSSSSSQRTPGNKIVGTVLEAEGGENDNLVTPDL